MSFFLVDDGFSSHDKVSALLDTSTRPDKGHVRAWALALWVLAGSECARRRNGGRVSRALARTLLLTTGRVATQAADLLVEVELWAADGDGYVFVNWAKRQRHNATSAPTPERQQARSEPVAVPQATDGEPAADQQRTSSEPVAGRPPSMIPDTSGRTPLSTLHSPLSSPTPRESEHARPERQRPSPAERMDLELSTSLADSKLIDLMPDAFERAWHAVTGKRLGVRVRHERDRSRDLLAWARSVDAADPAGVVERAARVAAADTACALAGSPWAWFCSQPGRYLRVVAPPSVDPIAVAEERVRAARRAHEDGIGKHGASERQRAFEGAKRDLARARTEARS